MTDCLRTYGVAPYGVAVLHGGPGAPGTVAAVARELARDRGVLEPLQTAATLEGQVQELHTVLEQHADLPASLIGWSWGAWLGFIVAARYPALVRNLILVGSGPFEARYADGIRATRLSRLSPEERQEVRGLQGAMETAAAVDRDQALARIGALFTKADTYDALSLDTEELVVQYEINQSVWREAAELRASGALLALGRTVCCPVLAIHGDYDPHPAEGVRKPLSAALTDFRFVLLPRCGHVPWLERHARDEFFRLVRQELR